MSTTTQKLPLTVAEALVRANVADELPNQVPDYSKSYAQTAEVPA